MKLRTLLTAIAVAVAPAISPMVAAYQTQDTRLLRFPDIHKESVTFVYAGDIYIANTKTGKSTRLTDHIGFETFPKFSPDGSQIAFSAQYNGSRQVYVMNRDGSDLKQLTYYNDVGVMPPRGGFDYRVLDWTPDGKHIVFRANRTPYGQRVGRPYIVPAAGGLEQPLAIPETGGGMLSPDGKQYVYTPIDREFRTWKRTRGGRAQDVWVYDLENNKSKQLTTNRATDQQPTWVNNNIYYVSDREYTLNLYKHQDGKNPIKVTNHSDFDVLWPSAGPNAIVYENGGYLYRFDDATQQSEKLSINVQGNREHTMAYSKNVSDFIDSMDVSHDGKRVLFTARGELFSVPVKNGPTRNLSHTPKGREISATWSPNGRYIAYMSDETGEYEIYLKDRANNNQVKQLTSNGSIWRFEPVWSPDNKKLLFSDQNHTLWWLDIKTGKQRKIDTAKYNEDGLTSYIWSPNSEDIVFVKNNENRYASLWHYNLKDKRVTRLTDDMSSETNPAFSPDGQQLYFTSERDFNLTFSSYEFDYMFNNATRLYSVAVNSKIKPLNTPLSDEISIVDSKADKDDKKSAKAPSNYIESNGFMSRVVALNVPAGNYGALSGVKDGVLTLSAGELKLVPNAVDGEVATIAAGVSNYKVSANAEHIIARAGKNISVIKPEAKQDLKATQLNLQDMVLKIDPQTEWAQMYREGWRTLRDWFYDENHHGQDWDAILARYQPMADAIAHRADLDYVLSEIAGEINSGHIYVNSGDMPTSPRLQHGLLGAEISAHKSGFVKIETIFKGENWHENFRSPLNETGINANVGDYIIAVNGRSVKSVVNFYELLENTQGKSVELLLSKSPSLKNSWKVMVTPIASETGLRYLQWAQSRAEYVNKLSDGRIGYVHLPNTHYEGNRSLFKNFLPQTNKEAMIIDDRYNGGGFIPEHMITWLARKPLNYWKRRGVEPTKTPQFAHDGPKAMLINGYSSSGGDALPYYFRQAGLGKLIGTRTWGGLIGISGNPGLVDGGSVIAATFRILDNEGNWIIENEGVSPDIEVIDRPELIQAGQDPSIERAVKELLKELKANPKKPLVVPAPPSEFGR
ncbi:tricorn protease [Pseudoalteromonas nigrifaciens]|uniref:Tricorn protease homolog n=6 Tax=Pseudoalteromonas TaxID=53246 RepID=A0AAC9UF94_9GAMM|nr:MULTISPECIES: S41 family peptidase [Pseudoalteromonas]ASM53445.1 tricorn protease [Pseudoalteromonas nigrifaciens]MBE0420309.1 PD40 domain-containing protein [Pseudoalteromonas nigrifaciens]GEN41102.1 tricorn protease [Pseudoalteromonas nigrifaciens]SUC52697.1 Tricorn protease homolog 1 [Pseudoalteromonas nigrifaciens]